MNIAYRPTDDVREPGLGSHWLGRERYVIGGGAMVVVPLTVGDRFEVVDPEGLQGCHLAAFNSSGKSCTNQLLVESAEKSPARISGEKLAGMLDTEGAGAQKIRRSLKKFGIRLEDASALDIFEPQSVPGSRVAFVCDSDCILAVGAPAEPMTPDQQNAPTDLMLWISRSQPMLSAGHIPPDPLADPVEDFRIKAATATRYEVKAGQYIQILDIDGRQCSDFQCFDLARLEQGVERCLDATVTRTLMGSAYPAPGLHAKFYDVDLEPVVEVIQDTCGRHDSFGLACTSKFYDDAGYPGHVNCSDNFNAALADYGVSPRKGWMAINLFFNTFFDDDYQLYSDEPWSRPGDYVLMRAVRDLVCVSSSCPDDIDSANAWNPTDIQVRVYDEKELFNRAIAYRKTTDAEVAMTQETGFHSETSKLTRNFVESNGYWLANCYTNQGAVEEYWACRKAAAMIDLSALRKYEVLGPDAEKLLQTCVTRDVGKLGIGHVVYTAMCNQSGGMLDDGTVFRLGKDNFRWIGGCDGSGLWLREQAEKLGLRAWVKNATSQLANMQVQGPLSRKVLEEVIWTRPDQPTLGELEWFRFSIARIDNDSGIPLLVSRTGFTGELGYEIFCHPRDGGAVWQGIAKAGAAEGIKPMGLEALDILRIEAGLILAGNEFCEQTDPFEAGIGFTVPLKSKQGDFIGRSALEKRKTSPQRQLAGLELSGREVASHGDGVYQGRYQVGEITSATWSPILEKNIALARLNVEYAEVGNELEVGKLDGQQKRLPATVVRFPHFDPAKQRVRGNYPDK